MDSPDLNSPLLQHRQLTGNMTHCHNLRWMGLVKGGQVPGMVSQFVLPNLYQRIISSACVLTLVLVEKVDFYHVEPKF